MNYGIRTFYLEMNFMELMYHMRDEIEKDRNFELEVHARNHKDHRVSYNPEERLIVQKCFFDDIFDVPVEFKVK